jgi:hypothetical protein
MRKLFVSSDASSLGESSSRDDVNALTQIAEERKKRSHTVKCAPPRLVSPRGMSEQSPIEKRRSLHLPDRIDIVVPETIVIISTPTILRIDTFEERIDRYSKLTSEQIKTEEDEFVNLDSVQLFERCKLCGDQLAVAELSGCKEKFCGECLGMFYSSGLCNVCDAPFTHVKNLKTGAVVAINPEEFCE